MSFHPLRAGLIALVATALLAPAGSAAAQSSTTPVTIVGDTPADYPGVGRDDTPTTIEVVRPERTIEHTAGQVLPIVLAGFAVLIAVAGVGFVLVRSRPTRPVGSH